jgi:hypothetical protein
MVRITCINVHVARCLILTHLTFHYIGLSDPYVKGRLGPFKFQTQIQKKTLSPKWFEEFKIPITSWESLNELAMEVCDKDHMFDDSLGYVLFTELVLLNGQLYLASTHCCIQFNFVKDDNLALILSQPQS